MEPFRTKLCESPEAVELMKEFKPPRQRRRVVAYVAFLHRVLERPGVKDEKRYRVSTLDISRGHGSVTKIDYYYKKGMRILEWCIQDKPANNVNGIPYTQTFDDNKSPFLEIREHLKFLCQQQDGTISREEVDRYKQEQKGLEASVEALRQQYEAEGLEMSDDMKQLFKNAGVNVEEKNGKNRKLKGAAIGASKKANGSDKSGKPESQTEAF